MKSILLVDQFIKRISYLVLLCLFFGHLHSQQYAYEDKMVGFEYRADDLLKRLTLEEKISLMQDSSSPIQRLGIKKYNWWNESLHGVARAGLATVFPQPIGMAATFDENLVYRVFSAVSDEARAKNTIFAKQGNYERYQGLTMWTPTVNILRDPRWGRGIETYGEDPYLTGLLGVAAVKGLQGPRFTDQYDKVHACAKHFAVHSGPEWNRHSFDAKNIKPRDLYETYLHAFEELVKSGDVQEVMCAYNRFEGEPCCGSNQLLMQILRKEWGFKGIVVSDCGAIADFYKENAHKTHNDAIKASAAAVLSGTDLECGSSYKKLKEAVMNGDIKESEIDVSVRRLLLARFRLGEMDDLEDVSWSKINPSVIASPEHAKLALEAARKSIVLLENKNNTLPLKKDGIKIAVMGPNANDPVMQWGNYNGTPKRTVTILDGIRSTSKNSSNVIFEQGTGLVENTVFESAYAECSFKDQKGVNAKYWNNTETKGSPKVMQNLGHPFNLCTSGNTVFAPSVELTGFSAEYETVFKPTKSGEVTLQLYVNGKVQVMVNDKLVKEAKTGHGARKLNHSFQVESGKSYAIKIIFAHGSGDAQLNFDIGYDEAVDYQKSLNKIKDSDIIVFAGGISPLLEGEEMGVDLPGFKRGDRTDINLPEVQLNLLKELHKTGKPIVFINCSGSSIALGKVAKHSSAIIQAWYPGQEGGKAVADVLFGDYNPSARLPITFYKNIDQLPDFENYDMEGRTYRYFRSEPLYPFGYGLSYSNFKYGKIKAEKRKISKGDSVEITIPVTNVSNVNGFETVQLYVKKMDDSKGPIRNLRAVKKVFIKGGETVSVKFTVGEKELKWWSEDVSDMVVQSGDYRIEVGKSSIKKDLKQIRLKVR
ncbi:beta-glucosidase [Chryseobacterium soldanellicola]|uniref:Beta-glucosidase n=1 Tax=Chryseobacterium soldanellicola TaxID=311333 RepID=A0A1H1FD49_9FLAO|nr:xylan 1,4-beta-xylosidase [Chryseobacterium soldanellicola]SDQ98748.1 beta-glucosidase [Chryseobacterium soldanellicola]